MTPNTPRHQRAYAHITELLQDLQRQAEDPTASPERRAAAQALVDIYLAERAKHAPYLSLVVA